MSHALPAAGIERHFLSACHDELAALKPGNVHVHAPGHGMDVSHFEISARASAPHIATPGLPVGLRIRRAVEASLEAAGCNTNLGIVLLCAPIAAAAGRDATPLRAALSRVLDELDRADASHAFAAIAKANPAGLGRAEAGDVSGPADMTLGEAMHLAAGRDRIARAYGNAFEDIFEFGLPHFGDALGLASSLCEATTSLHMAYLAAFPDSHIARKHGMEKAHLVREKAGSLIGATCPPIRDGALTELLDFDKWLKSQGLNPGTTADFVVATLFAAKIISSGPAPGGQ